MFTVWLIFHVIVSVTLILVVLMQSSKGEGLAGTAFGGSLSGAVFGGRGAASFLSKTTTVLAVLFMLNCAALAFMSSSRRPGLTETVPTESVVTKQAQQEREKMLQMQQQQQQTAPPAESLLNIQVAPGEAAEGTPTQPSDTGGK
ncbi:MAG: preprotein translocase subunit SecG [Candidatus Zixiibacteriota bacterium]